MANIVVSPHYLSTNAGIDILNEGGNAVDAAIGPEVQQHEFAFQVGQRQRPLAIHPRQVGREIRNRNLMSTTCPAYLVRSIDSLSSGSGDVPPPSV